MGGRVELGEGAASEDAAIVLDEQGINRAIGAQARIEGGIQRTVGVKPGNMGAQQAAGGGKVPADNHLAVGLGRDSPDSAIQGEVRGVEGQVHVAGTIEPGDAVARVVVDRGELPANNDAAIGAKGERPDRVIRAHTRIEGEINATRNVETPYVGADDAVDRAKISAYEDFAVRLQRERSHQSIGAVARIESRVERAVVIDTRDAVSEKGVVFGERAADDNILVRLDCQGEDEIVRAGVNVIRRLLMVVPTRFEGAGGLIVAIKGDAHCGHSWVADQAIVQVLWILIQFDLEVLVKLGNVVIIERD